MASRDFSFLSLRPPLAAYQSNGLPVPPNNVLTTSNTGAASFASSITISTINVNTENANSISSNVIDANTISANYIQVTILSTTTHYTSTISTTILDTINLQVNNTLSSLGTSFFSPSNPSTLGGFKIQLNGTGTGDAAGSNLFVYRYPGTTNTYLSNDGGGSITLGTVNPYVSTLEINPNGNVNVNGDLTVSDGISTNNIIAANITTQYLSTFQNIKIFDPTNNTSSIEVSCRGSTLTVNGFPVATDATVSTVSSVFWNDDPSGGIYNKNFGISPLFYQVGVGNNGAPLNATLDVKYGGGANYGNVFNVSTSNGERLTFDSNGVLSTNTINMTNGQISGLNTITPQTQLDVNGIMRIGNQSGNTSTFLINLGTNSIEDTNRSAYIYSDGINMQINNQQNGNLSFATNNSDKITILPSGNVGIGTINPQTTLDVAGNIRLSDSLIISSTTGNKTGFIAQYTTNMLIESAGPLQLYPSGSGITKFFSSDSNTSGSITVNNSGPLELENTAGDIVIHSQTGVTQFTSASGSNYGEIQVADPSGIVTLTGAANTASDVVTLAVNNIYIEPGSIINMASPGSSSKAVYMGMTQGDASVYIQNNNTSGTSGTCQLILNDTYSNGKRYQLATTAGAFYLTDQTGGNNILNATISGVNINTNLNVTGTAISRVATSAITLDPGATGWANFLGKYCFVNGNTVGTLTLPTNVTLDGTILVIRNIGSSNLITIVNSIGGTSILPGITTSYIYTTTVTPSGWYAL